MMHESKTIELPRLEKLELGQDLSLLRELVGPLKRLHSELEQDWNIAPVLSLYREIGGILISSGIQLEEPLSLQCVGLLISETLCSYSSREQNLLSKPLSTNLMNLLRGIFHYLSGKLRDLEICFKQAARLYKTMLTDFLDRNPSLPDSTSYQLVSALELMSKIGKTPFLLIAQGVENVLLESQNFITYQPLSFTRKCYPFLPEYQHKKYTLVLDLDETLGHLSKDSFCPRPGLREFLDEIADMYEVVCFTAGSHAHAHQALSNVDTRNRIQLVLHREHTTRVDGHIVKDLSLLGRKMNKLIMVDNLSESFGLQPENGVLISSWVGDPNDTELYTLKDRLKAIYKLQPEDVRSCIKP